MKKILILILFFADPSGVDAHCTWSHPGHCIGDVAKAAVTAGTRTAKVGEEQAGHLGGEAGNRGEAVAKGADEVQRTHPKALADVSRMLDQAAEDAEKALENEGPDVNGAAIAIGHYLEHQVQGLGKSIPRSDRHMRAGKFVDAIWHVGTDQIKNTEGTATKRSEESTLVNVLAQVAASAYAGPQGAAAYAAWYTYRATNDVGVALRVGITVGTTLTAMRTADRTPRSTTDEFVKKATVTGAIGGIGVAASGGDEDAIFESFLRSGGMVLVQDGYKKYTGHDNDPRGAEDEAHCISTLSADCSPPPEVYIRNQDGSIMLDGNGRPTVDRQYLEARRPYVGIIAPKEATRVVHQALAERGLPMDFTAKTVPVALSGSVYHDQWALQWEMSRAGNLATIAPVMVMTYYGADGAITDQMVKTALTGKPKARESLAQQKSPEVSVAGQTYGLASTAFQCFKGTLTRVIQIDMLHDPQHSMCRVLYHNENGISTPWYSQHNGDYCLPKGVAFVEKQVNWGWSCYRI